MKKSAEALVSFYRVQCTFDEIQKKKKKKKKKKKTFEVHNTKVTLLDTARTFYYCTWKLCMCYDM